MAWPIATQRPVAMRQAQNGAFPTEMACIYISPQRFFFKKKPAERWRAGGPPVPDPLLPSLPPAENTCQTQHLKTTENENRTDE